MKLLNQTPKILLGVLLLLSPLVYADQAAVQMANANKILATHGPSIVIDETSSTLSNDPNMFMHLGDALNYPITVNAHAFQSCKFGKIVMYEDGRLEFIVNNAYGNACTDPQQHGAEQNQ